MAKTLEFDPAAAGLIIAGRVVRDLAAGGAEQGAR